MPQCFLQRISTHFNYTKGRWFKIQYPLKEANYSISTDMDCTSYVVHDARTHFHDTRTSSISASFKSYPSSRLTATHNAVCYDYRPLNFTWTWPPFWNQPGRDHCTSLSADSPLSWWYCSSSSIDSRAQTKQKLLSNSWKWAKQLDRLLIVRWQVAWKLQLLTRKVLNAYLRGKGKFTGKGMMRTWKRCMGTPSKKKKWGNARALCLVLSVSWSSLH